MSGIEDKSKSRLDICPREQKSLIPPTPIMKDYQCNQPGRLGGSPIMIIELRAGHATAKLGTHS